MIIIKYNNKIILDNGDYGTLIYEIDSRKFKKSSENIAVVLKWLKENEPEYNIEKEKNFTRDNILKSITKGKVKTLIFNSAEICNLKCKYCFANEGTYNNENPQKLMALDQFIKIYNSFEDISGVEFFGGEPMLNYTAIEKFIDYLKQDCCKSNKKMPKLGIITNGTLINSNNWKFFQENDVKVTISIDGPLAINDSNRIYKNGKGTFNDIMDAISNNDASGNYIFNACEATLTLDNLLKMGEQQMIEYFDFFEGIPCHTVAILFAINNSKAVVDVSSRTIEKLRDFYSVYVEYCIARMINGNLKRYHTDILNSIKAFLFGGEEKSCGAGISQIFVNVNGDFYPCQRYYMESQKMCGFNDIEILEHKIESLKANFSERLNDDCMVCEYKTMCEGAACPGNNLAINGSENKVIDLMCKVNKIRNEIVLRKLFSIITNTDKRDLFMKCYAFYMKRMADLDNE